MTIVSAMRGVHESLAAADDASRRRHRGRGDRPQNHPALDAATILDSVVKTNRLVVVEEGPLDRRLGGRGAGARDGAGARHLDDAWRIATPDTPIPYSPPLEDAHLPGASANRDEITRRIG